MKIREQELLEKTFPIVFYDKSGKVTSRGEVLLRELPSSEIASARERCITRGRGEEKFDQSKFGRLLGTKMIVDAPFETEDDIKWKDMSEKQKLEFLTNISSIYDQQLGKMIEAMNIHVSEDDQNLSGPQ